jgi:antitoxin (DNA-binding transcriptional repressor) of toxin-antitoxin stability system
MKRAGIAEVKNNLSALIDGLRGGASVLIVDRGRPVARLEPVGVGPTDADDRLARLEREGVVRAARVVLAQSILEDLPPRAAEGVSASRALIEERRGGR